MASRLTQSRLTRAVGTLAFDRPRAAWPFLSRAALRRQWTSFHNRGEMLVANPDGPGYDCDWLWTSDLTLAKVFPGAGRKLLRESLSVWPVEVASAESHPSSHEPDVSFIIGHRGEARIPLLLATIASLRAQRGCNSEIIVVEQGTDALLGVRLPAGVRWIHQVPRDRGIPYSRSWAFNRGVRESLGNVVILHDNDVLAPSGYAAEALRLARDGYDAMRLQRYVFYLDEASTARVTNVESEYSAIQDGLQPEFVRQNCQGHTIATTRDAYFRIGGHDEGFVGWGGEDNEFFDRCRLLRFHPWGYLPFVHLWHAPQPEKIRPAGAIERLREVMTVPSAERARRLLAPENQTAGLGPNRAPSENGQA